VKNDVLKLLEKVAKRLQIFKKHKNLT